MCAVLAAIIVSVGVSRHADRLHQPAIAARLLGDRGEAEAQRADLAFAAGDGAEAARAAAQSLRWSLTHVEALRVLGRVRDAASDPTGAQLVMLAGALSWRDAETQDWLLQRTLAAGDYPGAMIHADALLRRKKKSAMVLRFLRLAAADAPFLEALASTLETRPRWRAGLIQPEADTSEAELAGLEIMLRRLARSAAPPRREEVSPLAQTFFNRGQARRGLALWQDLFPADSAVVAPGRTALLAWPSGARFDTPLAIDWHLSDDRAMSIATDAGGPPVLDLALEPGAFGRIATRTFAAGAGVLTLRAAPADDAGALDGIDWSVGCARGADRVYLARTGPGLWSTPLPGNCDAYDLALEVRRGGTQSETALRLGTVRIGISPR